MFLAGDLYGVFTHLGVVLGSLLAFYLVYGYLLRNHIGGWAFIVFASPGFLFLLHWFLRDTGQKHAFG